MSIKYAEIDIFRNITEEPIYGTLFRYLGYEYWAEKQDTIIIIFDDDTICDTKNEYINKHYKFDRTDEIYPLHFNTDKIELFYKTPIVLNDGRHALNVKPIFKDCKKYNHKMWVDSIFNMIYQDIGMNDVLSLIKIKSNEEKPRYLMAYDETIFCKSDIIYLVENMFRRKFA
jgi:hypothetical protein